MKDGDPKALNLRACLALEGAARDWRADLAELLRSDVELSRLFRDRLADAIENQIGPGPRVELKNHKINRDRFMDVVTKHEWMEIGRAAHTLIDLGMLVGEAIQTIATRAGSSGKKVEAALRYFRVTEKWVKTGLESEAGVVLGRDVLERLHHSLDGSATSRRLNAELLEQLGLSH